MTDHSKPHGDMNQSQLVALFADDARHPNALNYEMVRCKASVLTTLAEAADAPKELASLAAAEITRRQAARAALLADNPLLRAALVR